MTASVVWGMQGNYASASGLYLHPLPLDGI